MFYLVKKRNREKEEAFKNVAETIRDSVVIMRKREISRFRARGVGGPANG